MHSLIMRVMPLLVTLGHHVFTAMLDDLDANGGLMDATDIVLSGTSAGAGAFHLHIRL